MKRFSLSILISGLLAGLFLFSSCATRAPVSTPFPTLTPTPSISKQQLISEIIPLLDMGKSEAYAKAWNKLRLVGNYNGKYWDDEEIQALLWFSYDMINVSNGRLYPDNFDSISPDYKGVYHEQISAEVLKLMSRAEWIKRYDTNRPVLATVIAKARHPVPAIGMTAQQVLDSQWGKPLTINKTNKGNTKGEQWIYGDGKSIDLENGIVVAIHE